MPPWTIRAVLDYLALVDDRPHLGRGDHPIRPGHLPHGVRQKQPSLLRRFPNADEDRRRFSHRDDLPTPTRTSNGLAPANRPYPARAVFLRHSHSSRNRHV